MSEKEKTEKLTKKDILEIVEKAMTLGTCSVSIYPCEGGFSVWINPCNSDDEDDYE